MGIGEIDGTVVELYDAALESTLTHEVGHAIRVDSPKLYAELRNFVRTRLYREGGFENLVDMRRKQYADTLGREISYEYAEEEVICNSLGDIITSERVMNELAGKHRNLFGKIWHAIKEFFAKILRKMRGMDGDFAAKTPEQRIVERALLTKRRRLEDLFVKALKDASATSKASLALTDNDKSGANNAKKADNSPVTTADAGMGTRYSIKFLSEEDLPGYLRAGSRSNKYRQQAIDNGKKIILTTPKEIQEYIEKAVVGEKNLPTVAYGKVDIKLSEETANYSDGNIQIYDYYMELVANDIRHAYLEHLHAKEAGDIDLSIEDFINIPFYVATYDDLVYAIKYKSGNTKICISKKISDGRVLIIESVSKSHGSIEFKNMIGVTERKYLDEYEKVYKKRNGTNTGGSKSSNNSPRDETASTIIIHGTGEKNNPFDEKSLSEMRGGKLSLRDKLDREALSEAFYGMAESEAEREIVSKYRAEIDDIDDKIDERRRVIQRLEEIEGKSGFGGERARLEGKLKWLNAYITGRDTRLFELESAKPFRDMVERYETELGKKRQSRSKAMGDGQYMYVSRGRYNELMARERAS